MMTGHTKGPWKVVEEWDWSCDGEEYKRITVTDESGDIEVNVHPSFAGIDEANARLISAAPDLLEALIAMNAQLEADGYMGTTYGPLRLAAINAIAKALAPQ